MPEPAALLARLDRIMAELAELRAAVWAQAASGAGADEKSAHNTDLGDDDLAPEHLIDSFAAQERFGYPQDTIRKWCRTEGLGVMRGGRWLVSVPRLRQRLRLNGK